MTHRDLQHDELFTVTERQCEGTATVTDLARLNALLAESSGNRQRYLAHLQLHGEMHWQTTDASKRLSTTPPAASDTLISAAGVPMYRKGYEPQPFKLRAHHVALAAAALLAACGLAAYVFIFSADPQSPDTPPQPTAPIPVATLIQSTGDLRTPHGYPAEGDDYGRGEYTLDHGTAEFMLTNSVNVKLRGSTRLQMRNNMNVALTRGSAAFVVPKDATSFTVHLPGEARIIDLGTAFRVTIDDDGRRTVRVTEGSVRIETPTDSRVVEAPMRATLDDLGAVAMSDPTIMDEAFDRAELSDAWVWDSPGQATYDLVDGQGLRVAMPAHHNAWDTRGNAPILYASESLAETFVLTTEVRLVDGDTVMGSIAIFDTHRKNFAISLGLIRYPLDGTIVGLEGPGEKIHSVAIDASHVVLRLERTADARYLASYRLPDESTWHAIGEASADTESDEPADLRVALLSKAWHATPGTVDYRSVQLHHAPGPEAPAITTVPENE